MIGGLGNSSSQTEQKTVSNDSRATATEQAVVSNPRRSNNKKFRDVVTGGRLVGKGGSGGDMVKVGKVGKGATVNFTTGASADELSKLLADNNAAFLASFQATQSASSGSFTGDPISNAIRDELADSLAPNKFERAVDDAMTDRVDAVVPAGTAKAVDTIQTSSPSKVLSLGMIALLIVGVLGLAAVVVRKRVKKS